MTAQIKPATAKKGPTGWRKLVAGFEAFGEALDYDPQEYTNARIERLGAEVQKLKARLEEIESSNQRAA